MILTYSSMSAKPKHGYKCEWYFIQDGQQISPVGNAEIHYGSRGGVGGFIFIQFYDSENKTIEVDRSYRIQYFEYLNDHFFEINNGFFGRSGKKHQGKLFTHYQTGGTIIEKNIRNRSGSIAIEWDWYNNVYIVLDFSTLQRCIIDDKK